MIEKLDLVVDAVGTLHSKLVLLIAAGQAGKTVLLQTFAAHRGVSPLKVGAVLGARLAALPQRQRKLQCAAILRELADQQASGDLLLLDNIELLFDQSLQLDPLDLLKRLAVARRVVAVWPGELRGDIKTGRLTYADLGHPEHQDYGLAGLVPFEVQ